MVRRARPLAFLVSLVLALVPAFGFASAGAAEEEGPEASGPFISGEWKVHQDLSGETGLPEHALLEASEEAGSVPGVGGRWTSEGPTNIGGRVTGLAVDPELDDTVYLGAASGGVWRSDDAATTFAPIWPDRFPQSIGDVDMAADGTLYVGAGEANAGGGSLTYEGDGIYRSTDRGETWENVGLPSSANVGRIAIDPGDPDTVYVAAAGSMFRPGGDRGLYRSTDGGDTWQRLLAGANEWTGAIDVALDPTNPDRIFAAMWERQRTPSLRRYGGPGSGLYRSTDGGQTWQRLENVVELSPGDETGLKPDDSLSRVGVAVAPSDPDRVYVRTATWGDFGDDKGFYVSDDGGDTFTATANPPRARLGWWTGKTWVDPNDADHIFQPGQILRESFDGGQTWITNEGMHVDHHAMVWDPKVPGRVYEGNDGGVYRSDAGGATESWIEATFQPWTQFYSLEVAEQDPGRIAGGTQDNGSLRTWGGERWNRYGGGDGMANLISPDDVNVVYNCFQFGNCQRSTDGGEDFTRLRGAVSDRFNWFSPLEFAPHDPNVMYFGGNRLNRSTDGLNFEPISPDLTGGPGDDPVYPFGTLTTVWSAETDPDRIMAGTDDGRVWRSRDGGETWTLLLEDQPWVTRVKIHPDRPNWAFVTLSGYRAGTGDGHVLWSPNGGRTWRDVSGNLPQTPVNDVVIGPRGRLLIGTDVGVFMGTPTGQRWWRLGDGLPLASVTDIEYNAASGKVFAATYGRGIYSIPVPGQLAEDLR